MDDHLCENFGCTNKARRKFCSAKCVSAAWTFRRKVKNAGIELVECRLCGLRAKMLNNRHFKIKHGMTPAQYQAQFPDAVLYSPEMKAVFNQSRYRTDLPRPVCQRAGCEETVAQLHNKFCSYSCASKYRHATDPVARNRLGNASRTDGLYVFEKAQKQAARVRDGFKCRRCGEAVSGKNAHVHHKILKRIFTNPKDAHALDNLVTTCAPCHQFLEYRTVQEMHRRVLELDRLTADANHVPWGMFVNSLFTEGTCRN